MYPSLRQAYGNYRKSVREGFHSISSQHSFNVFLSMLVLHVLLAGIAIYYIINMNLSPYLTGLGIVLCIIPDVGLLFSIFVIAYYFMKVYKKM